MENEFLRDEDAIFYTLTVNKLRIRERLQCVMLKQQQQAQRCLNSLNPGTWVEITEEPVRL